MDLRRKIGTAVQLVGLVIVGTGLGAEIALKADWIWVMVTGGAITFALGTKIRHARE